MIGNDVVDLQFAAQQSNWRRKGFLAKVFSPGEQEILASSKNPEIDVWLLWSMKEAAYKAHQRKFNLPRKLNFLNLECRLKQENGKASGFVRTGGELYETSSEITSEYIYTSAESKRTTGVKNSIFEASSSEAKKHLILEISLHLGVPPRSLYLKKNGYGIPFFSSDNSHFFSRFSLSGHGRYSAYNLSLINCETSVKHS